MVAEVEEGKFLDSCLLYNTQKKIHNEKFFFLSQPFSAAHALEIFFPEKELKISDLFESPHPPAPPLNVIILFLFCSLLFLKSLFIYITQILKIKQGGGAFPTIRFFPFFPEREGGGGGLIILQPK